MRSAKYVAKIGPLPSNRLGGVGVKGGDDRYQSTPYHLYRLPQRPPWFLGGSRNWGRLPRGQTSPAVNFHWVGGPVRNLSETTQGVL